MQPSKPQSQAETKITFDECKKQVVDSILKLGKTTEDKRLNRKVVQSVGIMVTIPRPVIEELDNEELIEKYRGDSERMLHYHSLAVKKAKEDPGSRQLVVLNTDDFSEVQQCFQLIQYVLDGDAYQAIVYQRSADVVKLRDDWIFFCKSVMLFERAVEKKVSHIVVNYANIHVQIHS